MHTLFSCRLVSVKWRAVSTKLIKSNNLHSLTFDYNPTHRVYVLHWNTSRIYSPKLTLPKLTSFLKTTYSDGNNCHEGWSMDTFPVNQCTFLSGTLHIPQLQSFLNEFGEHIRSLFLEFLNYPRPLDESALMKSVETLLTVQATNLDKFTLWANPKKTNTEEHKDMASKSDRDGLLPSNQSDPEKSKDINLRKTNKLNTLIFEVPSRKILENIISISPHLQDIRLKDAHFHFLNGPVNQLHLLRRFNINTYNEPSFNFDNIKMIETALSQISRKERQTRNMPPIKFTTLCISFFGIAKLILESRDRRFCFVGVINKILECSADTLEYISLENYSSDTLRGIKWPAVLPKVVKLVLRPTFACGLDLFPSGQNFNIQDTFPKLKKLYFNLTAIYSVSFSGVKHLRKWNFGPVNSARFVCVNMLVTQIPYSRRFMTGVWFDRESHFLTNELESLFPNAKTKLDIVPF